MDQKPEIIIGKLCDPLTVFYDIDFDIIAVTIDNAVNGPIRRETFVFDLLTGKKIDKSIFDNCVHTIKYTVKPNINSKHGAQILKKYVRTNYLKLRRFKFDELTLLNNTDLYSITQQYNKCSPNHKYSMERYQSYLEQFKYEMSQDKTNAYITLENLDKYSLDDL